MGVGNKSHATYYGIRDGKIVRSFRSPTPNSKSRVNKKGKTVHEEEYDYIEGKIVDIRVKENEFGRFWVIGLDDGSGLDLLEFPYSCGYANAFLCTLPNVDVKKRVQLIPTYRMEGDKKISGMIVSQEDQAVKWAFTKDNPGDLPPLVQQKVKGKLQWDDSERMEYLEIHVVKEMILPKLDKRTQSQGSGRSENVTQSQVSGRNDIEDATYAEIGSDDDDDDELPF